MRRFSMMQIALGALAAGCLTFPGWASALTVQRNGVAQETLFFQSENGYCRGASTATISLPRDAETIRIIAPQVGSTTNNGRVQITAVKIENPSGRPVVRWIAEGRSSGCFGELGERWSAQFEAKLEYRQRIQVVLRRALGERMVSVALNREFQSTFANSTEVTRFACKKPSSLVLRCKVGWFLGDTSYRGQVRVRLGATAATPNWAYKLRIAVTDEYCQSVTHAGRCVKVIRRHRRGMRLGWATYDEWASMPTVRSSHSEHAQA